MTVKIWGIKSLAHFTASKTYNENEEKTSEKDSSAADNVSRNPYNIQKELKSTSEKLTQKSLKSLFGYAVNSEKTTDTINRRYVSGYLCNPAFAIEEFIEAMNNRLVLTGKTHNKNHNMAFHIVQSFPPDVTLSNEEIHRCGVELCEKIGQYQGIICSHINPVTDENGKVHGACKHNHIIINAYSIDPNQNKYHDSKETYRQLQKWNDEIAKAHNQPIILLCDETNNKSVFEDIQIKNDTSWKEDMRKTIDSVMAVSSDWNDFKRGLAKENITIREGKYITYTDKSGHKARDRRLGNRYSKAEIEMYWKENQLLNNELHSGYSDVNTTSKAIVSAQVFYPQTGIITSKNKRYKIKMWDEYGRRRSSIELVILLAAAVLNKNKPPETVNTEIKIYTDKRLQGLMDSISLARKERITSRDILAHKLSETGREISTVKSIIIKSDAAKKRMAAVNNTVSDYMEFKNRYPNLSEENKNSAEFSMKDITGDTLEEYKKICSALHRYNIHSDRDIDNFISRYSKLSSDLERYKSALSECKTRYSQLKRIEYNVNLAEEIAKNEEKNQQNEVMK